MDPTFCASHHKHTHNRELHITNLYNDISSAFRILVLGMGKENGKKRKQAKESKKMFVVFTIHFEYIFFLLVQRVASFETSTESSFQPVVWVFYFVFPS